jgi:hypothetical protein
MGCLILTSWQAGGDYKLNEEVGRTGSLRVNDVGVPRTGHEIVKWSREISHDRSLWRQVLLSSPTGRYRPDKFST